MRKLLAYLPFAVVLSLCLVVVAAMADSVTEESVRFGFKIRIGGRYDNVRMCVATPPGVKGGIAADISAFTEIPVREGALLHIDLPVMRPILFAAAFHMLQFEPTAALVFFDRNNDKTGWVAGPALGVSLHYGPDYRSGPKGEERTTDFFAIGPIIGAYAGVNFRRSEKKYDFQLGISPYITPLFGINDAENHKGIVVGGLLDGAFKFGGR